MLEDLKFFDERLEDQFEEELRVRKRQAVRGFGTFRFWLLVGVTLRCAAPSGGKAPQSSGRRGKSCLRGRNGSGAPGQGREELPPPPCAPLARLAAGSFVKA